MLLRLFLLSILLFSCSSLVCNEVEKHIRQNQQKGETAMQKRDFHDAIEAFEECLDRLGHSEHKRVIDWNLYVDIGLRLTQCYSEIHELKEVERVCDLLLAKRPPEVFVPKIKLLKARLCTNQKSAEEAFCAIQKLGKQLPKEYWSNKERSFFHALESSLNNTYDALAAKAKLFLLAGLYQECVPLFEEVLQAIEKGSYPRANRKESLITKKIRYRCAQAKFLASEFQNEPEKEVLNSEILSLNVHWYQEKKEYEKALDFFQKNIKNAHKEELEHYKEALFEMGTYYYQCGNDAQARCYFEKIPLSGKKKGALASIFLAKILLNEKKALEAARLLSHLAPLLKTKDPLREECAYLQGEAAYALNNFQAAANYFEYALLGKRTSWNENARYHLAWSYVQQKTLNDFNKAEKLFCGLLHTNLHDAACLSLGQLALLFKTNFPNAPWQESSILYTHFSSLSIESQLKALLLTAENSLGFKNKEEIYVLATAEKYSKTPNFAHAWYCRGLNFFQEGLVNKKDSDLFFKEAIHTLQNAFQLAKSEKNSHFNQNAPTLFPEQITNLLNMLEERESEKEEVLYLKGIVAANTNGLNFTLVAEESLNKVIQNYPKGNYRADALYVLGSLYYKMNNFAAAKKNLNLLISQYPYSKFVPEALFLTAEASIQLGESGFSFRENIYKTYPNCLLAPEAYFRQFSYPQYLQGDCAAHTHLKSFPDLFPQAPQYLVTAYYLLGKGQKNTTEAKSILKKGLDLFETLMIEKKCDISENLALVRYQMLFELVNCTFSESTLEELTLCEKQLLETLNEFKQQHLLATLLQKTKMHNLLFEECMYKLLQCYLKQDKVLSAQKMIKELLLHFENLGIKKGAYLQLVWQEQAQLAISCRKYDIARECFQIAQECGQEVCEDAR